jgi:hypothetical protein
VLVQPSTEISSNAQSPNTSTDIIEPGDSPQSRVIDVTQIDNILRGNPERIHVAADDKRTQTALVPSIRTKLMAGSGVRQSEAMDYGWFTFSLSTGLVGLTVLLVGLLLKRKRLHQKLILAGPVIIVIAIGIGFVTSGMWTQKPLVIFLDNASNSKYDVAVNGERFRIDERSYVYKQIRWSSLGGSKDAILEITVVNPQAEKVESVRTRVRPDKTYLYNIGGANTYTIETEKYGP